MEINQNTYIEGRTSLLHTSGNPTLSAISNGFPCRCIQVPIMMSLGFQVAWLLILGLPTGCIAWTVTHEEVFREPRQYCQRECERAKAMIVRKFFYLFTCEYCFSHYVAAFILALTRYKLLFPDWRGYVVAFFALVWVANLYMSIYNRLRLDIKHEQVEIKADEKKVDHLRAA